MRRVLVVDDHPIARYGLRRLLEGAGDQFEIAEASDGAGALQRAHSDQPDLVILDLRLPAPRGTIALCQEMLAVSPASRILICTAFGDVARISECIASGARGCILKDADAQTFAAVLDRIEAGETVIDPRIAQQLAVRLTKGLGRQDDFRLTKRERGVLTLLGDGLSNRQIADHLYLSEHTVKGYVTSLLEKLGARSRLEAVVLATRAGLLATSDRAGALTGS
jgi:DNA-binding NarL/FixJ family response regulator